MEVLRVTTRPIVVHVDSKTVVDGVARGRSWCEDSRREAADLWRKIWNLLDEMLGWVQVVKINAHTTYQDALEGRIPWEHWLGNAVADRWAKAGSAAASRLSPVASVHSQ